MNLIFQLKKLRTINPLLIGSIVLIVTAFFSVGYDFADEHFQILEIAAYKTGTTALSNLPWEFHAQMRAGLQPAIAYLFIIICNFFSIYSPFIIAMLLRLLSAGLILVTIQLLIKAFAIYFLIPFPKKLLYVLFFLTWFFPCNFVRFSSENWSGIAFMLGMALYLLNREKKNYYMLIIIGFLTGLSFVFRYQSAFMIIGLGLWMIFIGKESIKKIFLFTIGNIAAILIGILIDRWLYGNWVLTFWNYLDLNIIQDKVSEFGILPWWFYFENIFLKATPPIGLLIIISFLYGWIKHPKNIISWITIPFVLIHILIGHKELRFLYPLLLFIPLVVAFLIADIQTKPVFITVFKNRIIKTIVYILIGMNGLLLLMMCFKPSDELIPFYKVVYNFSADKNTEMIINGNENPYVRGGKNLPISFYQPKRLSIHNIQNTIQLNDSLVQNDTTIYLYAIKNFDDRNTYVCNHLKFTKIYQTYPEWVGKFNINNWMSRTKIWTIYEIKKDEGLITMSVKTTNFVKNKNGKNFSN